MSVGRALVDICGKKKKKGDRNLLVSHAPDPVISKVIYSGLRCVINPTQLQMPCSKILRVRRSMELKKQGVFLT